MTPLSLYASDLLVEEHIAKLHDLAANEQQLKALRRRRTRAERPLVWRLVRRNPASAA